MYLTDTLDINYDCATLTDPSTINLKKMKYLPEAFTALAQYSQFIIYKIEHVANKNIKCPVNYKTDKKIDPHQPKNWMTAADAITACEKLDSSHGVGFVLTDNDPFFLLDIDHCLNTDTGEWSQLSKFLCETFKDAAIEVSSSGDGLHIIGSGESPPHGCTYTVDNIKLLEFYTTKRFIALTGTYARGDVSTNFNYLLPWLVENYFSNPHAALGNGTWRQKWDKLLAAGVRSEWRGPLDDDDLIKRACRQRSNNAIFKDKVSFRDLWTNNTGALTGYSDQSSIDAALAQHLAFWTGDDARRMHRLMLRSELSREKWEREDYLPRTIVAACEKSTAWCVDKLVEKSVDIPAAIDESVVPTDITGQTFLTAEEQKKLFKGCVYVVDAHKILIPGGLMLKQEQFKIFYGGYSFPMDPENQRVSRDAWEAFNLSQNFRKPIAESFCFKPNQTPGKIITQDGRRLVNMYWPVTTRRKVGNPELFLQHIDRLLPNKRDQIILISYMAACVQHKGVKFQWCPLIQGVEGNGKTLFNRCVAFAIGFKYSHFPKALEIAEKYNDWLYAKLFIGVEDIYVPDSQREVLEILKPMITEDQLEIRRMHQDKIMQDVCCNFILNSNHKDAIRKTRNDRRFAPFFTAQQEKEDLERSGLTPEYFLTLYKWLNLEDGYSIVSEFLHTYEITDEYNPANKTPAPITSSTEDAISYSMGGIEQYITEAIEQGLPGFKDGWISSIYLERLLDKISVGRKIPPNKRRELVTPLGFDWHPGLNQGRVNCNILPDGGKPKLFILKGHPDCKLTNATEIAKAYTRAQEIQG